MAADYFFLMRTRILPSRVIAHCVLLLTARPLNQLNYSANSHRNGKIMHGPDVDLPLEK